MRKGIGRALTALGLLGLSAAASAAPCNLAPGSIVPIPSATLNPYLVIMDYSGGVDASSSSAPPPINRTSISCDGNAGIAGGVGVVKPDRSGSLSMRMRAGLDAGISVTASAAGSIRAAGSGEISVHNEVTQPIAFGLNAGSLVHGHFGLVLEGVDFITVTNIANVVSLIDIDFQIHSHARDNVWTDDVNGVHQSSYLRSLSPGPSSETQRFEIDIPGTIRAGGTVDIDLHLTTTALAEGSNASTIPRGEGTLSQDLYSTFAFAFIPDDSNIHQLWASDPYFGGLQPSLPAPLPLPGSGTLLSVALLAGIRRCRRHSDRTAP